MEVVKREVLYFPDGGSQWTGQCLEVVGSVLEEGRHRYVVVATTTGRTGVEFCRALSGRKVEVVVVTHSVGFKEPNYDEMSQEYREEIEKLGGMLYTGTILMHSLDHSLMTEFKGVYPSYIIAHTLRRLGQGMKVAAEIVMEACDAGLVPEGEEVIAVAGTARGADTVAIIKAAASKRFHELKIMEILAKPRDW